MKKLYSPFIALIAILVTSCGGFEKPEVVREVLIKELPSKTWLTTKISMKSSTEYTSLVEAGMVQRINFYDNTSYYKFTDAAWPFVVSYIPGDYQGYGEAEVASHYITDYTITKMDFVGSEEITAHVDVIYAVNEFLSNESKKSLADINPTSELCYGANYTRSAKIKLKKYDDGWHIDRDSKEAIEKLVTGTDSLKLRSTPDSAKVCFTYAGVRIKSYLVYDDDGSLSKHDPLKELNFSGEKPHSNVKIVIIGNLDNITLLVSEPQNGNRGLIEKKFDLKDSAEFVFPAACDQIKIDLRSSDGKILYQDFMEFSCGG